MKKFFLLAAIASLALASCDDVPAPYGLFDPTDPNNQGGGGIVATIVPEGDGSAESPFNVAAAIAKCKELGTTLSSEVYYVKGIAKSVNESGISQYGNINVDMVDASGSSDVFVAWQIVSFGGAKFTEEGVVSVGDTIVIKGKIYNYMGNTPESEGKGATQLVSVNGKSGNGGGTTPDPTPVEAKGTGTASDPFNIAAAINKCKETGETATADRYYVKGIVKSLNTSGIAQYGNINVDMIDEPNSTAVFTAYQIMSFNGAKFTSDDVINTGDTIVVVGNLVNYKNNTPETSGKGSAWLVSVNGTVPTPPTPSLEAGNGTLASPYNTARALALIKAGTITSDSVYVSGRVVASPALQFDDVNGVATYTLAINNIDTTKFTIKNGLMLGGKKFNDEEDVMPGDTVIVYGVLSATDGLSGSRIVSLNGEVAGIYTPPTPKPEEKYVAFDFASNCFNVPSDKQSEAATFTYEGYSITLTGSSDACYYFNSKDKYLILGKKDATLTFSGFSFPVSKIEVTGRAAASSKTEMNVYVGENAVSTKTVGIQTRNTYEIAADKQAAGNAYTLKVESAHNAQFVEIKVYKAAE